MIGIDVGTTSIKLLELSRSGKAIKLERSYYQPIAPGLVVEHQITKPDQVTKELEAAIKKSGTKIKRAAICVPSSSVITKTITVQEDVSDNELESLVELEADRIVPYALDEVNIDFQSLGKSSTNPGEKDVQVVVCRKNVVEGYTSVLEDAGIIPVVIDVDTYTLARMYWLLSEGYAGGGESSTTAMVDFGSGSTRLIVFHGNKTVYSRESPFGGRQLVDAAHQKYGLSYEEVMKLLYSNDLPKSYKTEVLKPFVKTLVQELLRAFQFFYSSSTYNTIDRLMLSGGCAQIGNIDQIIEKRVEIPTMIANPFSIMKISSRIDKDNFRRTIPSFTIACGLALRGL